MLAFRDQIVSALGGEAQLSPPRRELVDLAARASLYLDHLDAWLRGRRRLIRQRAVLPTLVPRQGVAGRVHGLHNEHVGQDAVPGAAAPDTGKARDARRCVGAGWLDIQIGRQRTVVVASARVAVAARTRTPTTIARERIATLPNNGSESGVKQESAKCATVGVTMAARERDGAGASVHGHCERGVERVREAFGAILASGAALTVCVDTHPIVDVSGGHARADSSDRRSD